MLKYWLIAFIFFISVKLGNSIQCHQCTTIEDPSCLDYYAEDNVDDCEDKDTHCVKYKTTVLLRDSGYINGEPKRSVVVTRSCERANGASDGCSVKSAVGGALIKCICSQDACNSSPKQTYSTVVLLTVTLSTLYRYF